MNGMHLLDKATNFLRTMHEELEMGNPDSRLKIIEEEITLLNRQRYHLCVIRRDQIDNLLSICRRLKNIQN